MLVGLGNPGPKYDLTRHNAGWWILDALCDESKIFWEPGSSAKFHGKIARGDLLGCEVVCLKPETFMNISGKSVVSVANFFKIPSTEWIVFHDDIDLQEGVIKARVGGGHGGHNGLRSIIELSGQNNFKRIKLGVGRPEKNSEGITTQGVSDYVLQRLAPGFISEFVDKAMPEVKVRLVDFLR